MSVDLKQAAMADALATARLSGRWGDAKRAIDAAHAAVVPCHFCGNPRPTIICCRVHCISCGANGPEVEGSFGGPHEDDYRMSDGDMRQYPAICEGVRLWNTRAPDPAVAVLEAEVARLREEILRARD